MSAAEDPVFDQIIEACERKGCKEIMGLKQDWCEEIIAQFYTTLWIDRDGDEPILHWALEGNRYQVSYSQFAAYIGFG